MGKLRKIGRRIGKGVKSLGRKLKKGLGKVAKAFGKLGPLGSVALSFIIPGVGGWLSKTANGASWFQPIAEGLVNAGNFVNKGVGRVFNRVTDAVEWSMNTVSKAMPGGEGVMGTNFRNWASGATDGFISPAKTADTKAINLTESISNDMVTVSDGAISGGESVTTAVKPKKSFPKIRENFKNQETFKLYDTEDPNMFGEKKYDSIKARVKDSKQYDVYKKITPIQAIGSDIIATEDYEKYAALQAKKQQADYFSAVGSSSLVRQPDPNVSFIDFNNASPTNDDMMMLENSYSGILGT